MSIYFYTNKLRLIIYVWDVRVEFKNKICVRGEILK